MSCMIIILVLLVLGLLGYYYLIKPLNYWTRKGVPQSNKAWPILGDMWSVVFRQKTIGEFVNEFYYLKPSSRYIGIYGPAKHNLMITDIDLIKQITVKDFDHFLDHQKFLPEEADPYWSKNLFALKGQKWKDMRSTLSPVFTSSKMKQMFVFILETSQQFTGHFLKQQDRDLFEIEMKATYTRFTNDIIGSVAFGIKCDSLEDPDNEFYRMGQVTADMTSFKSTIKIMTIILIPKLARILGLKMIPETASDFLHALVTTNMQEREANGIIRHDMIHLLMEAKKNRLKHEDNASKEQNAGFATGIEEHHQSDLGKTNKVQLTDVDITAQALIFFLAGFETVSNALSFLSYELATHPDEQQKLRDEILEVEKKCGGKVTYDALLGMKYMDMVVSEVLRLWPGVLILDRLCTKEYTIQPVAPEEVPVVIERDTLVTLPAWAMHRDPKYFPDPDRFDPERFSDENKGNIRPYSYYPFGVGPRVCIGNRLALMEIKTLCYQILLNFEIVPTKKSIIPLNLKRYGVNSSACVGGFWFGLKRLRK